MTYGQYRTYPEGKLGCCKQLPSKIIAENAFRDHAWVTSHFRTFYAWLFQAIDIRDFQHRGKFITASTDLAMMFPMLEMAGPHCKFISEVTYTYNKANPLLIEANKKASLHAYDMRKVILRKKRYEPIAVVQDKRGAAKA